MKITPVILSGGSGTRLWPISRNLNPKQFLDFFGEHSLFQQTALRTKNSELFENPIIICNHEHRFSAAEELQKINITPKSILLEPIGRNTAPAIAAAAFDIQTNNSDDDLILIMPSDHIIKDEESFISSIQKAKEAANNGYLITFGITPNKPETGYGYIKKGNSLEKFDGISAVKEFVEKPNFETANKFLQSGDYFWNSGIFLFKASAYLETLKELQKDIFDNCQASYSKAEKDLDFIRLELTNFEKCQNTSIDYAIMEGAKKVAVAPVDMDWSDVGSWQAISEITPKDNNQNSLIGDIYALNTTDCYINSQNGLIAAIGVKDLIVVSLKDATLIANKNSSQDVKKLFEILKEQKRDECNSHTKVMRPWGSFETVDISDRFKVKRIIVKPKSSLSLQTHNYRSEHWVVVKGEAIVTCGEKEFKMKEDESTYIPVGQKHRLENQGDTPLELIEIQTGSYLGEDDIIRFIDKYGRSPAQK